MEALGWYQKTVVERSKECTVVVGRKKTRFIQRLRGFIVVLIFFFLHFGPKTMNHRSFTKKKRVLVALNLFLFIPLLSSSLRLGEPLGLLFASSVLQQPLHYLRWADRRTA